MLKCRSGPQDKLTAEKVMALGERSAGQNLEVHLDVGGQEMMNSEGRVAREADEALSWQGSAELLGQQCPLQQDSE